MGDGDFLEGVCFLKFLVVFDCGIGNGDENGWLLVVGLGEEFVCFFICILIGGEFVDDGDEVGLWKGKGCVRGEVGDVGDVE